MMDKNEKGHPGYGVASVILGINAVCFMCIGISACFWGTLAIIFGIVGIRKNEKPKRKTAIIGLCMGAIAIFNWLPTFIDWVYNVEFGRSNFLFS